MKKVSLAVIAALILLYPAIVWLMGYAVEKRTDDALEQIRQQAPYLWVVEHRFRRGWYSSQVDVTFEAFHDLRAALQGTPDPANPTAIPLRVTVHSVIHHGPICGMRCIGLAGIESRFVFSARVRPVMSRLYGSTGPVTIHSRLGFFGGGSLVVSSPAFNDTVLDGARLGWGGLEATIDYGARYDSISLRATAPRAMFTGADGKRLEITGASFDTHSKRLLRTLYEGDSSLAIGRLDFADGRPTGPVATGAVSTGAVPAGAATISDLRSASHTGADAGFMTMSVKIGTGAIATAPLALTGTHFDFTFRHLDVDSLEALTAALRDLNRDASLTPAARTGKMLAVFAQRGATLLLHQPELAIDRISIAAANGGASLNGTVRLNGVVPGDFVADADTKAMVRKLDADLDLTLDDAFLRSLPGSGARLSAQLQSLADQGLLSHENGKFHTKILFRQGSATFNGKSFRPGTMPAPQPRPPGRAPH